MAMTKEEQRAAADRIMAQYPMTEEEKATYARLCTMPEDYPEAGRDLRVCQECGEVFETKQRQGQEELSAMQQFSDHSTVHNYSPAQWAEAHRRIVAAKGKPVTQ